MILKDLSKFQLVCPLNGPLSTQSLHLYKSESPTPTNVSYQVWLKLAWWFLRRPADLRYCISSAGLWPGELKIEMRLNT